jgi:hypothetical protein
MRHGVTTGIRLCPSLIAHQISLKDLEAITSIRPAFTQAWLALGSVPHGSMNGISLDQKLVDDFAANIACAASYEYSACH